MHACACPEAFPTCKLKHSFVKASLKKFASLYPKALGSDLGSLFFNCISLSFRVFLYHWRKCTFEADAWRKAVSSYKPKDKTPLDVIPDLLDKIIPVPEEEEDDDDDDDDEGCGPALVPTSLPSQGLELVLATSQSASSSSLPAPSSAPCQPSSSSQPPTPQPEHVCQQAISHQMCSPVAFWQAKLDMMSGGHEATRN